MGYVYFIRQGTDQRVYSSMSKAIKYAEKIMAEYTEKEFTLETDTKWRKWWRYGRFGDTDIDVEIERFPIL